MTASFDVDALVGRTLGDVLDEIAPGWSLCGFSDGSLIAVPSYGGYSTEEKRRADAEIKRRFAPILAALRDGTVLLVSIEGKTIPLWVWLSGRWTLYRDDEREVEWLEALTQAGQKVEYYSPKFARPAAEGGDKKPVARSGKRGGGNSEYDDAVAVERARAAYKAMTKPSKKRAAETAIDQLIAEGHPVVGINRGAWIRRVSRDL